MKKLLLFLFTLFAVSIVYAADQTFTDGLGINSSETAGNTFTVEIDDAAVSNGETSKFPTCDNVYDFCETTQAYYNAVADITNSGADGATKGVAGFTANDFDAAAGIISLDYTNGQASSAANKGFLTAADWSTFNSKGSSAGLESLYGYYTTKTLVVGGLFGTTISASTVTANTVSANTVYSYYGAFASVTASTVSANTISCSFGYFTQVTGNTVSGNTLRTGSIIFPMGDGTSGQVMKTNGSGIISWAADDNSIGATAYDDITDPDASGSIGFTAFTGTYTSATSGWQGIIYSNSVANVAADSDLLTLSYSGDATTDGDANVNFLDMIDYGGAAVYHFDDQQFSCYRPMINYEANAASGGYTAYTASQTLQIMNGAEDYCIGYLVNWTNANHTLGTLYGYDAVLNSGDADATETAYHVGTGWDNALDAGDKPIINVAQLGQASDAIDMSAVESMEIPNGAAPTVNAVGEIAIDTTDKSMVGYDGAAAVVYAHPVQACYFAFASDGTWDNEVLPIAGLRKDMAITIVQIDATCIGGTSLTFNLVERAWGSYNTAVGESTIDAVVADADGVKETVITDAAIAAEAGIFLKTGASAESGTVNYVMGTIYYTMNQE